MLTVYCIFRQSVMLIVNVKSKVFLKMLIVISKMHTKNSCLYTPVIQRQPKQLRTTNTDEINKPDHFGPWPKTYNWFHLSCVIRKPECNLCENKGADQLCSNCTADQRLCFCFMSSKFPLLLQREHGGVVVEHQTPNREVLGSIPTGVIMLCPWARHINSL